MTINKNKQIARVGHEFAAAMTADTPIIEIAKMVSCLATALDKQTELSEQLAVENASLLTPENWLKHAEEGAAAAAIADGNGASEGEALLTGMKAVIACINASATNSINTSLRASKAITDIIAERQRQQSVEGWTPEHDDEHKDGELADAAACYALHAHDTAKDGMKNFAPAWWPWDPAWYKRSSPRRDLVKAGALIAAEIERLDRAAGGEVQS